MDLKLAWGAGLLVLVLIGCGQTITGKVPLVDGKLPLFFKVGETKPAEVLDRFGEPSGYREYGNQSVMIYEYGKTTPAFIPLKWDFYRIFLVFEDNVLKKTEVQKLGRRNEPAWKVE